MPFKKNSFDFSIEKGTIDALMCGEDKIIPKEIMNEIIRVTEKKVFFITHGGCEKRKFLFMKNDLLENVKYFKQPLSDEADLINCMRATNKDKSLKEVMKNAKCLLKAIAEYKKSSKEKKTMKMVEVEIDLNFKDILDLVIEKKLEIKDKGDEDGAIDAKEEGKELEKSKTNNIYNPLRQNYCYVYMISKKGN